MSIHGKQIADNSIKPKKINTEGYTPSDETDLVTVEFLESWVSKENFQIPSSTIEVYPEFIELGKNHEITIDGVFDPKGEDTLFSNIKIKRGITVIGSEVSGNTITVIDELGPVLAEGEVIYSLEGEWTGNGLEDQILPVVTYPVKYKAPILLGTSPDSSLNLSTIYNVIKTGRAMDINGKVVADINTSDGDYIYFAHVSNKGISKIIDRTDNTTIPLEIFTEIATGNLTVPVGDGVDSSYTYEVRLLRTPKLGNSALNLEIQMK